MIMPSMLVCNCFLISVCMFIVSKALLISSATVIVRAWGVIWLNSFVTVSFYVCSTVTIECCVCTSVAWVCLVCLLLCKEEGTSPITKRRNMGLYEVPLSKSLLGFVMGNMLSNFYMCGILLMVRAVLNMFVRNVSQDYVSCYFLNLVYYLLGLSCGECNVIS